MPEICFRRNRDFRLWWAATRNEQAFFALSRHKAAFDLDEAGLRQRAVAAVGELKAPQLIEL
jgi:hypothetical protein